jgi:hypothetical protein
MQPACPVGCGGDIDRDPVLPGKDIHSPRMIGMLMGNEDRPDFVHSQSKPFHASLCFAAGNTGIDEHCIGVIAYIIAVSVASGVQCGKIKGHSAKKRENSFGSFNFLILVAALHTYPDLSLPVGRGKGRI